MPACFQLIDKETNKPVVLQKLDDELRDHFGEPPDEEHWLNGWYDCIRFKLAIGKTFAEIRVELEELATEPGSPFTEADKFMLRILDRIEERYSSNAWHESSSFSRR